MGFDRIGDLDSSPTLEARLEEEFRLRQLLHDTRDRYNQGGFFSSVSVMSQQF